MDPPGFRRTEDDATKRCFTCDNYLAIGKMGICSRYDRPMYPFELCDSYTPKPPAEKRDRTPL